ncbi:MAG TPA: winged helix-turn-helix transcriptional regulator [Nitrososphaeraceae archaeon]|jgi:DNA-binding Lrp family transcriptional regulator|nr:winged helix-turn-helix transcriptional regulator [Nitrososphaeraceae archaeon]
MILDKNDLTILPTLARDCRTSYSSIGSQIGLSSKSVKARVKRMVDCGFIEKFVVRVNPAAFGYRTALVLVKTGHGITKDDVIQRAKEFGDLAHHAHHMGSTSVAALIIKKPLDEKIIQSLNDRLKPATVIKIVVTELSVTSNDLSETDLRIIKCLLLPGARIEISDIAKEVGISEKTTTRRLNRMKEMRLLDFSLQCSPAAMIGYIQFVIPITVAKSHYHNVLERMYSEFQANILYSPSIIEPEGYLAFVLFGENVFVVDHILARVNSFEGVNSADAYILTKWQYYDDWIMKEINKRLLLHPILHRSR